MKIKTRTFNYVLFIFMVLCSPMLLSEESNHNELHKALLASLKHGENKYCFGDDQEISRNGKIKRTGNEVSSSSYKVYCNQKQKEYIIGFNLGGEAMKDRFGKDLQKEPSYKVFRSNEEGVDYTPKDTWWFAKENTKLKLIGFPGRWQFVLNELKNGCTGWTLKIHDQVIESSEGVNPVSHDMIIDLDGFVFDFEFEHNGCDALFYSAEFYRLKQS